MSGEKVIEHYNALPERTLKERSQSRIFYLRNLNNWVKSMLIQEALDNIRQERGRNSKLTVLDLCCGKGGDLLKWKNGRIDYLVCVDIADVSISQCKERFRDLRHRAKYERRSVHLFDAEFINADVGVVHLPDVYKTKNVFFDLCSCQFSLHYCFETEAKARKALENACGRLKIGGYFIGTIPDANGIVHLLRSSEKNQFANEICHLRYTGQSGVDEIPLFGGEYDFKLHDVVNCPEYLVHFPLLVKLLQEQGMQLVYKLNFAQLIDKMAKPDRGQGLMGKMQALEPYPAASEDQLAACTKLQYAQADAKVQDLKKSSGDNKPVFVGTISKDEWTVACLYLAFVFKKIK